MLAAYLRYPSYLDHVEPTIASIAWLGMHGHALYPNWESGNAYGLVYGPVLYLLQGSLLLIDPTITASKALGVVSLLIAFCLIFAIIKQRVSDNFTRVFFVASVVMLLMPFGPFVYWTRAEPFLILISVLALIAAIKLRPLAAGVVVGCLAGIAMGFKLHGFVYVAPTAIMTIARAQLSRDRINLIIIGFVCAIIFALLPFLQEDSSLIGYLQYLNIAAHHRFAPDAFSANLLFALVLLMPAVAFWFWRRPAISPTDLWLLGGLCTSIAIAVVIGGISGPYHLLPFAPLFLYAAIIMADAPAPRPAASQIFAIIFLLLLLAYGPASFIINTRLIADYYRNSRTEHEKIKELQTILAAYPKAEIGISDDRHYSDTYYRIFSVLQNHPLHIDFVAWEDLAYVGVEETNIIRFIKKCEVPIWILPLGEPFTKLSWYTKQPILSNDFRRVFSMNYGLIEMDQFYQVWRCRSPMESSQYNP
jgi:hypothetical protein